jgi:hypothetical protein
MNTEQRDDTATIRLLREECQELQTRVQWLFEARMDTLHELERAKWETRYWRVIAIAHHVVLIGAVVLPAALAAWR